MFDHLERENVYLGLVVARGVSKYPKSGFSGIALGIFNKKFYFRCLWICNRLVKISSKNQLLTRSTWQDMELDMLAGVKGG